MKEFLKDRAIDYALMLLVIVMLFALHGRAQDKPATDTPKLKDSVALEIRNEQLAISQMDVKKANLIQQFQDLTNNQKAIQDSLESKMTSALKDSGIDTEKWDLDRDTLTTRPKFKAPVPTTPAAK